MSLLQQPYHTIHNERVLPGEAVPLHNAPEMYYRARLPCEGLCDGAIAGDVRLALHVNLIAGGSAANSELDGAVPLRPACKLESRIIAGQGVIEVEQSCGAEERTRDIRGHYDVDYRATITNATLLSLSRRRYGKNEEGYKGQQQTKFHVGKLL